MTRRARLADFENPLHHERCAFVTDFDGTLSPLVDDPADARPLPAAVEALRTLAAHLGLVAVVSGRPVEFLRERLPIEGVVLVGQYGLERLVDGVVEVDARAREHADAITAARLEAERRWPNLLHERKGDIAFTVHWRTAPSEQPNADELAALANQHGLVTQPGRMACEYRPPVSVDKGDAFLDCASGYTTKAFAGDDVADVPAFRVTFADGQPVRIAVRTAETPAKLLELADVVVEGTDGFAALLADLATTVSAGRQP